MESLYLYTKYPTLIDILSNSESKLMHTNSGVYNISFATDNDMGVFIDECKKLGVQFILNKIVDANKIRIKLLEKYGNAKFFNVIVSNAATNNSKLAVTIYTEEELDTKYIKDMLKHNGSSGRITHKKRGDYYLNTNHNIWNPLSTYSFSIKRDLEDTINLLLLYGLSIADASLDLTVNLRYNSPILDEILND
jgi:hypothetical protein